MRGALWPSELSSRFLDCELRSSDCGLSAFEARISTLNPRDTEFLNHRSSINQSSISPGGPRGSRTHYHSIKSRVLILMSFRPNRLPNCGSRIWDCGLNGFEAPKQAWNTRDAESLNHQTSINYSPAEINYSPAETRTRITRLSGACRV